MAAIKKRKIGKQVYYYVEHSFKAGKKVKVLSRYLGKELPYDIDEIKDDLEYDAMNQLLFGKLKKSKLATKRSKAGFQRLKKKN